MSITDGSYYCGRCGDDRTVCWLCSDMVPDLVKRDIKSGYEGEKEIAMQSASIKREAAKRQGF